MSDSSDRAPFESKEKFFNVPGDVLSDEKSDCRSSSQQLAGNRNLSDGDKLQVEEEKLKDFYVELETLESLLFREELEIVLQSNPQAVSGTFTISVRKVEGRRDESPVNLLIHISGRATVDGMLECSTSITSCITTQLVTIDENRLEYTQLDIGDKKQQMYFGCEGNQYYCVTQLHVNNEVLSRNTKEIPLLQAKDLISEGANVILLRQMAIKDFKGELQMNTILADGRICPSKYMCGGSSIINRDGEEITVYIIKRVVQESADEEQTLMSTLTCTGQLIEHEWVGGLCLVRVSPCKKVTNVTKGFVDKPIPLEYHWETDMELTSCYLDYKSHQIASHKSYFADKPEIKEFIADFVQAVLLLKPDDVIQFAVDYFSTFIPDTGEEERIKMEEYDMVSWILSDLMNVIMKHITEKEMMELLEELVSAGLRRVESRDLVDSLQAMIQSASKLSEILNFLLNFFLEEADKGMVSGILAVVLRSACKFKGEAEVLEVLSRVMSTEKERELVSTLVRSASLMDKDQVVGRLLEKLLMLTIDTVQEDGSQLVPELVQDVVTSALESRQIADMIILELIERATSAM